MLFLLFFLAINIYILIFIETPRRPIKKAKKNTLEAGCARKVKTQKSSELQKENIKAKKKVKLKEIKDSNRTNMNAKIANILHKQKVSIKIYTCVY